MTVTVPARIGRAEVVPLTSNLTDEAASLFAARLDELRADVPAVPPIRAVEIAESLRWLLDRWPGWAAVADGRLVGYVAGLGLEGVRGPDAAALVPEWGWAVDRDAPASALTDLYTTAAAEWKHSGRLHHLVQAMPVDLALDRELAWLGFGPCVVDAICGLAVEPVGPVASLPPDIAIRPAGEADIDGVAELDRLLHAHVQASPTFLHGSDEDFVEKVRGWLSDPEGRLWVAETTERLVSFVVLSSHGEGVARVVTAPGIAHIVGAFTLPGYRSRGIAEALVAASLSDARERGRRAVAVDFETANPLARRFWTRFFAPVCVSYERFLDPRVGEVRQ